MNSTEQPIKVWCLVGDQKAHVKPVEDFFSERAVFIYDAECSPTKMLLEQPDILVCVNDFAYEVVRSIDSARENKIPSLVIQDGILEWRCQYENPKFGAGGGAPQHQPVMADKIACLGYSSARHIASWGNTGKVEVTGMPRLDYLLTHPVKLPARPGNKLLVMTAKKPWFTDEQREITLQSLSDVKDYLETRPEIEVTWRLTKNVASLIGVENRLNELSTADLAATLEMVDSVISTVSTAVLESMLANRPVAALDYHNVPRFVPTAWTISSPGQIGSIVQEILNPPENKRSFQNNILADALRCDGLASAHVAELVTRLAHLGRAARESNSAIVLPANILAWSPFGSVEHSPIDLATLYPDQHVFKENDISTLQVKLARAEAENQQLRQKLVQRSFGFWLDQSARIAIKKLKSPKKKP